MDVFWRVSALLALVFANGFFVAAEFAIVTVRRTRVEQLVAEGRRGARALRRAVAHADRYIAATQLGITMASIGLGWIGEPVVASLIQPAFSSLPVAVAEATAHSIAVAIAFAIVTALHIVLGELAPKTIALQKAERTALVVVRPTELFMRLFWPFIRLLNSAGRTVVRLLGLSGPTEHASVHSEEELKMLVTASQEAGVLEEHEERMVHRVFGFADISAGQIMTPRTELVAVPGDMPATVLARRFAEERHVRLPVYRAGAGIDDVIGFAYVSDLLRVLAGPAPSTPAAALAREALVVPETLRADALLAEMRRRKVREAIVIDEYGGTAGLVTYEALMERIVGETDEELGASASIREHPDGSADIDGLALVQDVNAHFGLHIDEATYTTIGGYVLGRLGRHPRLGDTVEAEGRRLRVDELDRLRVSQVWLSAPPTPADSNGSPDGG
jgi:putative hemolysin